MFKNGKLIDVFEGQKYIAKEEIKIQKGKLTEDNMHEQIYSLNRKHTLKNRLILFDEVGYTYPSEEEILAERNKLIEMNYNKEIVNEEKLVKKEKKQKKQRTIEERNYAKASAKKSTTERNYTADEKKSPSGERAYIKNSDSTQLGKREFTVNNKEKSFPNTNPSQINPTEKTNDVKDTNLPNKTEQDEIDQEEAKAHETLKAMIEEKAEEIKDLEESFTHSDLPFYKIYLSSNVKNGRIPNSLDKLDEIVYTYDKKNLVIYTVGYYGSAEEARKDLSHYQDMGFKNAKIVGIFRGMLLSESAAKYIEDAVLK